MAKSNKSPVSVLLFCCLDPQIVVMDITLPGTSGIEVMRRMLIYKAEARV